MKRPRVMHIVVGGDIGGAERLLVELARRPEPTCADHEVAVITPNRALVDYLHGAGLVVHDRGRARENALAYLYRSLGPVDVEWLTTLFARRRIDIAHTHLFGSHVLGTRAALRAGKPQLRTEHGLVHYFDPSCAAFTRWAAARTDRIVAVSVHVRDGVAGTAPAIAERISVNRNGIDATYWSPRESAASVAQFSLAIVCRLTAWKRVDLAIRATSLAGVPFVVVGDGEERARLEALAQRLGAPVRFVGYQRDPRPFIADASAVLSTAKDEPLGLSALESLAMERPVIAISGGGIGEIVQADRTGILVGVASAPALAGAIARVRQDPEGLRDMGRRGRRFAVEQCSIDAMCERYAAHYAAMVEHRSVHVSVAREALPPDPRTATSCVREPPRDVQRLVRRDALEVYCCPTCHGTLRDEASLVCDGCAARYDVRAGIPRFVGSDNYAKNFGFQWKRFQATQLDSRTGLGLSARRFWAESRWPRDLAGELILEAGSGAGRFTEVLARTGARLFTFDCTEAIDANRLSNPDAVNVDFAQADILRMPFRDCTFDRVVCLGVLQHTPAARDALAALVRVLKPGGYLVADHYVFNALTPFRGKYWLRPLTRGRRPETMFPWVTRYFDFWYSALGMASPLLGPATAHLADVLGICDYRPEIPEAPAELVREMSLLDTFDMLLPAYDRPRRPGTLRRWLEQLGMCEIDVAGGYNGIEVRSRRARRSAAGSAA